MGVGCTHWIPGEAAGQVKVVGLMNIHHISLLLNLYPATSHQLSGVLATRATGQAPSLSEHPPP